MLLFWFYSSLCLVVLGVARVHLFFVILAKAGIQSLNYSFVLSLSKDELERARCARSSCVELLMRVSPRGRGTFLCAAKEKYPKEIRPDRCAAREARGALR